jgi:hypothetical protein
VRVAAISIDVDSLHHYLAIHGLRAPAPEADPIYTVAMPRFFALLEEVGVPATLFLIGRDVGPHLEGLRVARKLGCEIASHSFSHDYRLFRRSRPEIEAELGRAEAALLPLSGAPVVGFRAPGYNTSRRLLGALVARGYAYDSSLLPAPAYWAARAAAIARYRAQGRASASQVGSLLAFSGPLEPYRTTPDAYWRPVAGGPLCELPMACVPGARTPLIGTSWVLAPRPVRAAMLAWSLRKLPCLNFELHAIDLLDASDPGVPRPLAAAQVDLRRPVRDKLAAFRELFTRLRDDRPVRTLADISAGVGFTTT